jgi:hypothetical protein
MIDFDYRRRVLFVDGKSFGESFKMQALLRHFWQYNCHKVVNTLCEQLAVAKYFLFFSLCRDANQCGAYHRLQGKWPEY